MKKLKEADMWISIVLIAGFTAASLINRDYTFIIGYFVVGGWQVISMIIHVFNKWFTEKWGSRYIIPLDNSHLLNYDAHGFLLDIAVYSAFHGSILYMDMLYRSKEDV